jgi:hypothetical protein
MTVGCIVSFLDRNDMRSTAAGPGLGTSINACLLEGFGALGEASLAASIA